MIVHLFFLLYMPVGDRDELEAGKFDHFDQTRLSRPASPTFLVFHYFHFQSLLLLLS